MCLFDMVLEFANKKRTFRGLIMKTKEEIVSKLDYLFEKLKEYPHSEPIAEAIDKNLELLAELEESEQE